MSNTVENLAVDLKEQALSIYTSSQAMVIENDENYQAAVDFAKVIKKRASEVKAYFAPMKEAAHQAHKQVCDRETEMLKPLTDAETKVKGAMSVYALKKAEAARIEAERQRKEAEEAGFGEVDAVVPASDSTTPKTSGVSQKKDWKITVTNALIVPDYVDGVCLRPVDEAAVLRVVRANGGGIAIPGVSIVETVVFSINCNK